MRKTAFYILVLSLASISAVILNGSHYRYTVVLDPGHGGLSLNPIAVHGDKYDPVEKKYLAAYQQGAAYGKLSEGEIAYDISLKIKKYLDLTTSSEGRRQFHEILKKYNPDAEIPKDSLRIVLSRGPGYSADLDGKYDGKTDRDYNADFRLFDYPEFGSGGRKPGIISRINEYKPDLVVSIHLDSIGPTKGAMAAVVSPGYDTFKKAVEYIQGDQQTKKKIRNDFLDGPYANWIQIGNERRSAFEWFLCDSWIYFTGYWSQKNGMVADMNKFRGVRQDYVLWKYAGGSWEAGSNQGLYQRPFDLRNLDLSQKFWEREMSQPERWKREGGKEGVGGDNLYASHELLRFIRYGLLLNKSLPAENLPDIRDPHWSTWSMPTYINAINAFLELGFLNNRYDRDRLVKYTDVHAEALAVGIYSLLYGLKGSNHKMLQKIQDMPAGEAVDLQKYENFEGRSYFKSVL